jgi:hypothetical protein
MNVDRLLHNTHLAYQRRQLQADRHDMPVSELRGLRRERSKIEAECQFRMEWFTHLRPNFWKAYFDTLSKLG